MKRLIKIILVLIVIAGAVVAWFVFGSATSFTGKNKFLYIHEGQNNKDSVMDILDREDIIANKATFRFIADRLNMWGKLKPGKFEIKNGESALYCTKTEKQSAKPCKSCY